MDTTNQQPTGRNEPCPCKSGRKYKQCCLDKDEQAARLAREEAREREKAAAAEAPAAPPAEAPPPAAKRHGHPAQRVGFSGGANPRGFQKTSGAPRKTGGG